VVLRPGTVDEVAQILRLANESETPIVPQGGNTGLVGGQTPQHGELVLSLNRLDRIREVDPVSNTMTCEAGVTLLRAREAAAAVDRLYPQLLPSEGTCTIGGNLSTNAGGTAALAYGIARSHALGLEVVLADGRVLNGLSKLRKDNTGYDLKNLFIGAEGTLGIITAAVLKLFPRPTSRATVFCGLQSAEKGVGLLSRMKGGAGSALTTFELIPRIGIDMALRHGQGTRDPLAAVHAWYVLLELSGQANAPIEGLAEELIGAAIEAGEVDDAVVAASIEQSNALWRIRETIPDAQRAEGVSIKHDISVPVASVPRFIEEADAAVKKSFPGVRTLAFGHVGDGNVHYNVFQPQGSDGASFLERWHEIGAVVYEVVARFGGSISAEHGVGQMKRDLLPGVKDKVALDLMRALKRTLDPQGILNPGKVL
ncbi:MAG: FAD-binding oxidoreductase, partial [Hyphomicrobiales bacterium]|nr:FAD-binding oxidoreductase [Hyphomicrobiales bacterium]